MKTQIAFMFEGVKYFTFYGSNYMAGTFPDTNVVTLNDVTKSKAVQGELRKLNGGINWNMTPTLINEHLSRVGKYIQGTGDVVVDGVTYHVEFSPNGMDWKSDNTSYETLNEEVSKEVVPEVTDKSDTEKISSIENEVVSDTADTDVVETNSENVTTEEIKNTYYVPVNPNSGKTRMLQAVIENVPDESLNIPPVKTTMMQAAIAHVPPREEMFPGVHWGNNKGNRAKLSMTIGRCDVNEGLVFHGSMPNPNTSEGYRNRRLKSTTITGRPSGMSFGRQMPFKRYADNSDNDVSEAAILRQRNNTPVQTLDKDMDMERAEALMRSWQNAQKADLSAKWEQPVPETVSEEVVEVKAVTESDADIRKAAKEAVRATLPAEINDVIGDIPVEMLTSIAEFTTSPVDIKSLEEQGDLFCIDRRWHRQGKWYCIDVVCNTSRYFFNSKLGVSIEIPISYCKAWYDAIM